MLLEEKFIVVFIANALKILKVLAQPGISYSSFMLSKVYNSLNLQNENIESILITQFEAASHKMCTFSCRTNPKCLIAFLEGNQCYLAKFTAYDYLQYVPSLSNSFVWTYK